MKINIFNKLALASLLFGAYSVMIPAESDIDSAAGVGNGSEISVHESITEEIDRDNRSDDITHNPVHAAPLTTQELIDTGNLVEAARTGNLEATNAIIHGKSSSLSVALFSFWGLKPHLENLDLIINQSDDEGNTPLLVAAQNGHTEIVQALLNATRSHYIIAPDAVIAHYITPENNIIAARFAAENGHTEIVKILRTNRIFPSDYTIPLERAILNNNLAAVQASCNKYNPNVVRQDGIEPLILASSNGLTEIVKTLLAASACPNIIGPDGNTALHVAAENGHIKIVKVLLDAGAFVDIPNFKGHTPLFCATCNGHTDIVKTLLAARACPDRTERDGFTALHMASTIGHIEIVQALLDTGTCPDTTEAHDYTALQFAASQNHTEIVKKLLDAGACPDIIGTCSRYNSLGNTAFNLAALEGHTETAQLLINAYHKALTRKCPAIATIEARKPTCLLEKKLPIEVAQLISKRLEPHDVASLRSVSTNCLAYASHEFEKIRRLRADRLKKKLISLLQYAADTEYELARKRNGSRKTKIAALLKQEWKKAQQLDLCTVLYKHPALTSSYSEDSDIAGPAPQRAQLTQEQIGTVLPIDYEYKSEYESDTSFETVLNERA